MLSWIIKNKEWLFSGIGLSIIAITVFFVRRLFFKDRNQNRPKIEVSCLINWASSGPTDSSNKRYYNWRGELKFYNSTNIVASNIRIEWLSKDRLPITKLDPPHLKGFDARKMPIPQWKEIYTLEEIRDYESKFGRFLPPQTHFLKMLLSYTNDNGVLFYTLYNKEGKDEECTYCEKRPIRCADS